MNPDKVLIALAAMVLTLAFVFGGKMIEEIQVFQEIEKLDDMSPLNELAGTTFLPFSQQERMAAMEGYIEKLSDLQQRISTTIVAKHLFDLRDSIIELQANLLEQLQVLAEDEGHLVSFVTLNMHYVFANPEFPKEHLLHLGRLIDQEFPEEEALAIFVLDFEDYQYVLDITPLEGFDSVDKSRFQEFGSLVSKELFEDEPVTVRVDASELDEELSVAI